MKIAVIITGGTIMSGEKSGYYSPSESRSSEILRLLPHDFEAEVFSPYIILSEQLNGKHLSALISEVDDMLSGGYDGIMVIHGTDTLQYTAAALSLAFGNAEIPIVIVSANYVLSDKRSNGADNVRYGAEFMRQRIGGVFVSYRNTGENPSVFPGHTLLSHLPYSDKLYSTCGAYGYYKDNKFINLIGELTLDAIGQYTLIEISPVFYLKTTPGMNIPDVEKYSAVLIEAYHSGTLPTDNTAFVDFCKNCGKPVYAVGISEGTQYESSRRFDELGIRILPPVSPVFAYILLWHKYSK